MHPQYTYPQYTYSTPLAAHQSALEARGNWRCGVRNNLVVMDG